jgi:uncharacterized protein YndB with AHSA1/START domain
MSASPGEPEVVRVERVLPADRETVFAAWTQPERMAGWFSPRGSAEVEAEVVVGGRLRVAMIEGDVRIDHDGEFLEVDPPERLVFTWRSPYTGDRPSVVTIELFDDHGSTRIVLTHRGLPAEERSSHAGGWGAILDRLGTTVIGTGVGD